jgi:membrane-bound inhibitor of C-type lysozyme
MKTHHRALIITIVLLILVSAIAIFWPHPAAAPVRAPANSVSFYCASGKTIVATFATSTAALALSDGRALTLPQALSADGGRYEASTTSDIVFWNKGDDAFITENDTTTFDRCVAGSVAAKDGTDTFTDQGATFSFAFPSAFTLSSGEMGYTQGWSYDATSTGLVLAVVSVPQSYEPGTNFGDAKLTLGVSSDPDAVAGCITAAQGEKAAGTAAIGGTTFSKFTLQDAGAGNRYDIASYRTVRDGQCYALEHMIHFAVLENYPVGQVQAFDEAKVAAALEGVVQSFKFLK